MFTVRTIIAMMMLGIQLPDTGPPPRWGLRPPTSLVPLLKSVDREIESTNKWLLRYEERARETQLTLKDAATMRELIEVMQKHQNNLIETRDKMKKLVEEWKGLPRVGGNDPPHTGQNETFRLGRSPARRW